MFVSNSEIFSVSLTIFLHLSHVKPSPLTEKAIWQAVQVTITGEDGMIHHDSIKDQYKYKCTDISADEIVGKKLAFEHNMLAIFFSFFNNKT